MTDIPHRRVIGLILGAAMASASACSEPRPYTGIHDVGGANGAAGGAASRGGEGGGASIGGGAIGGMSGSGATPNVGEPAAGGSRDHAAVGGGGGIGENGGERGSGNGGFAGSGAPVAPVANWDSVAALRAPVLRHRPDHRWIGPSVVHTQAAFMLPRR